MSRDHCFRSLYFVQMQICNPKQCCLGFLFICFGFFGLFFFYKEFILQRIRKEFSWQPSQQANLVLTFPNSTVINFNTLNEASESEVYLEFCFYNFSDHCVMWLSGKSWEDHECIKSSVSIKVANTCWWSINWALIRNTWLLLTLLISMKAVKVCLVFPQDCVLWKTVFKIL